MQDLPLTALQLDALREIGNVGADNAAGALSELLNKTVMIDIPKTQFLRLKAGQGNYGFFNERRASIAHYSKIMGGLKGGVLTLFTPKDSLLMSNALLHNESGSNGSRLTQIELSSLSESVYIFSCAYLNALSGLFNLPQLIPRIPEVTVEGAPAESRGALSRQGDAIMKDLCNEFTKDGIDYAVSIENDVSIDQLGIHFFASLLLEGESVKKALALVGL